MPGRSAKPSQNSMHQSSATKRGRPKSDDPKQVVTIRLNRDLLEYFRGTGPGWQTRINDTLRRAAKLPARKVYSPR